MNDFVIPDEILSELKLQIFPEKKYLLLLSGGPDSTFLFYSLLKLNITFSVMHINHNLRGKSSDNDEKFVKDLCEKYKIKVFIKNIDFKEKNKNIKFNIEEKGRIERYSEAVKIACKNSIDIILSAHNYDDDIETFFLNLFRGSGLEGLTGIKQKIIKGKVRILRPLLFLRKDKMLKILKNNNLNFCIDESNSDIKYNRNYIRNIMLPDLKKVFHRNIYKSVKRTSELLADYNDFIKDYMSKKYETLEIDKNSSRKEFKVEFEPELLAEKPVILKLIIQKIFNEYYNEFKILSDNLFYNVNKLDKKYLDEIYMLIMNKESGKSLHMPGDIEIIKTQKYYLIRPKFQEDNKFNYQIISPGEYDIPEINKKIVITKVNFNDIELNNNDKNIAYFSLPVLDLSVRNRKPGDKFKPRGFKGKTKTLKKYFIEKKIPVSERDKIPVFIYKNEIIWISGIKRSALYIPEFFDSIIYKIKIVH